MSESTFESLLPVVLQQPVPVIAVVSAGAQPLVEARCAVSIRVAGKGDLPFIDALQKMHTHMVGWFPSRQMEEYIDGGHVLIAEDERRQPMGYCIAKDHYMGRDDVGIVYQLNVAPLRQRHLVGAMLIKAWFERAAYGCRLFSCWCAQDIQANVFWESMGFIPLAFRAGSRGKQRIHIFWQRRIGQDDQTTPYWYPYQTGSGALREDRLVLPIPAGTHWRDAKPVVLPALSNGEGPGAKGTDAPGYGVTLPGPKEKRPAGKVVSVCQRMAVVRSRSKHLKGLPAGKAAVMTAGGIRYVERGDHVPEPAPAKPKRAPRPRAKVDARESEAARELRDRWLEQVNGGEVALEARGKYQVGRAALTSKPAKARRALPRAAKKAA